MDVSVVILNYNTFELTRKCIASVYRETKGLQLEIILVDNASTERNSELFKKEFPAITLIKNKENTGFAKGNNIGIEHATGKVILLLNSDTELVENSIFECYKKLNELGDKTGVITCKLTYPDGLIQKQCSRFPGIVINLVELFRIHKLMPPRKRASMLLGSYFDHETDFVPDWCWGTFFMFRKSILGELPNKKLNDDYFMYYEDVRWCYDIRKTGRDIYYYAGTKIIHHVGKSTKNASTKSAYIIKNELRFIAETKGKVYQVIYRLVRAKNILLSSSYQNRFKDIKTYLT